MSAISQKSITGITSITTPAGVDNQLTLHVNDTSEALKLDHAGNIHIHNHVNTTGISSASNFKTGSSNLHSSGLSAASIDVGSNIKLGNAGIITATSYVGGLPITDGANNRIITASSASAIQGEAGLTFDGTTLSNVGTGFKEIKIAPSTNNSATLRLQNSQANFTVSNITGGSFSIADGSDTRFTINSSGVVGINNDLDVDGHTNLDNVSIAGVSTFTGEVVAGSVISVQTGGSINIPDKLIHSGDPDTAIRFPSADTISFETAGSTRLHIHSDGRFRVGTTSQPSATVGGFQLDMGSYPGTARLSSGGGASGTTSASLGIYGSNHHASLENGSNAGASLNLYNYNTTDGNSTGVSYHNSNSLAIARILGLIVSHSSRTGALVFMTSNGSHPTEKVRIDSDGVLKIERGSASDTALEINTTSTTQACRIGFSESGTRKAEIAYSHDNNQIEVVGKSGQGASIFTNALERVRITSSGSIGINQSSPQTKLHLYDSSNATSRTELFRISGGNRTADSFETGFRFFAQSPSTNGNRHVTFTSNANTGLTIQPYETSTGNAATDRNILLCPDGGKIGINETNPINKLTISNTANQDDSIGNLQIRYTGTANNANSGLTVKNYKGTSQVMQWETFGVRIGNRITTNSGSGNVYITAGGDTVRLSINASNGNFTGSGSDDISDGRLKENIASISNATATIKQLLGKTFTWKEEAKLGTDTRYGFIAQELKTVLPDLVHQDVGINRVSKDADKQGYGQGEIVDDHSDDYKDDSKSEWSMTVNTSGIIPVLVEAFKELEARIAALEGS